MNTEELADSRETALRGERQREAEIDISWCKLYVPRDGKVRTRHLRCQAIVHTPSTPGLWPRVPRAMTCHWKLNRPSGPVGPSEPKETNPKCHRTEAENGMWAEKVKDVVPSGLRRGWFQRSSRNTSFKMLGPRPWPFRCPLLLFRSRAAGPWERTPVLNQPAWWLQQSPANPPCSAAEGVMTPRQGCTRLAPLPPGPVKRTRCGQAHSCPRSCAQKMGWRLWPHSPLPKA